MFQNLLSAVICAIFTVGVSVSGSPLEARADIPDFFLVVSSNDPATNLKPVRYAANGYSTTLGGTGLPIKFNFAGGDLQTSETVIHRGYISFPTGPTCATYGPLDLVVGSSSNKCANHIGFGLSSFQYNSQLGAELVYRYTGGFYACGSDQQIYYKTSPSNGQPGLSCSLVHLYTVPVIA